MNPKTLEEMRSLIEQIEHHRRCYYLNENPEISDFDYDQLEKRLKELEKTNPDLIQPDSPSQKVGGYVADSHPTQQHLTPMLSLDNAYDENDLESFFQRVTEGVPGEPSFTAELKIDGLSLSVIYRNGSLSEAVTRGDGTTGEQVTANARTIRDLPLFVSEWQNEETVEIRGEVYLSRTRFRDLNEERIDRGLEPFANPRNAASGSLRMLDSRETSNRGLNMFVYQALGHWASGFQSHFQVLNQLKTLGLPVNPYTAQISHLEGLLDHLEHWRTQRETLDYDIDGMVIKLDQLEWRSNLGFTSKFPKWAVAYKFQAEQATTQIESITLQVGRTGVITPVAELKPTLLAGTTVSRATLHNFDEIARKDIRIGDWVFIEKGGDIIPKVVKVVLSKRSPQAVPFPLPETCPRCSSALERDPGQVALRCVNLSCPAQVERRIQHFTQRKAMDIRGLGKEWIQTLTREGVLSDLPSIYALTNEKLDPLERTGEKWIQNLLKEIEASKTKPFRKVLFGLGIPMVGEKAAELLVQHFKTLEGILAASEAELASVHGIGEQMAFSIRHHLQLESYQKTLQAFRTLGLNLGDREADMPAQSESAPFLPLKEKTIVITGTLEHFARDEAAEVLKALGANVTSSVSKNTSFLLAGAKAGSKLAKAQKLNIEIVDEEWLQSWQRESI